MKKLTVVYALLLMLSLVGCHRNRQVQYARVPVDTARFNDEEPEDDSWKDEGLIDIPDEAEVDINRSVDTREVDEFLGGTLE